MRGALLLLIAVLVSGCSRGSAPELAAARGELVAELVELVSDVKARLAAELAWKTADEKMRLANYDAVRTGSGSSGKVTFNDRSVLDISENSMVIVLDRSVRGDVEESVVALPKGKVKGRVAKRASLVVRTPRGWIRASKGSFQASVSETGALQIRNGEARLELLARDRERVIAPRETVTVAAPAAPPPAAEPRAEDFRELPAVPDAAWQTAAAPAPPAPAVFRIERPKTGATVTAESIEVAGELSGDLRVLFNGKPLRASKGRFSLTARLTPGLNVLTFQIVQGKQVRYETVEVIRR